MRRSKKTSVEPGLLLIQIDGLSRSQFERAWEAGRVPFLRRLITRESHQLHTMYSGMPSSTPAVQGELFYGQRCAVPAFAFREADRGEIVRMFDQSAARAVEWRLAKEGEPLLKNGSAYCDIYSGGADQAHFCASTIGWGDLIGALAGHGMANVPHRQRR
jgi:hypothetical protein